MFNNVKKLFSYNWSSLFKNIVPKGNKSLINDESYKNINRGAILKIVANVVSQIAVISIAIVLVVKAYKWLYGGEILGYAIKSVLSENAVSYLVDILVASILPIGIIIFNSVMKKKQQNTWPYFIVAIFMALNVLYSLWGIIGWVTNIIVNPIFGLIGLATIFITFLGNVDIIVGCVDFCLQSVNEFNVNNPNQNVNPQVGSYQPNVNQNQVNNGYQNVGSYQPNPNMNNVNQVNNMGQAPNAYANQNMNMASQVGSYQPNVEPVQNINSQVDMMNNYSNQTMNNVEQNVQPQMVNNQINNAYQPYEINQVNNPQVAPSAGLEQPVNNPQTVMPEQPVYQTPVQPVEAVSYPQVASSTVDQVENQGQDIL